MSVNQCNPIISVNGNVVTAAIFYRWNLGTTGTVSCPVLFSTDNLLSMEVRGTLSSSTIGINIITIKGYLDALPIVNTVLTGSNNTVDFDNVFQSPQLTPGSSHIITLTNTSELPIYANFFDVYVDVTMYIILTYTSSSAANAAVSGAASQYSKIYSSPLSPGATVFKVVEGLAIAALLIGGGVLAYKAATNPEFARKVKSTASTIYEKGKEGVKAAYEKGKPIVTETVKKGHELGRQIIEKVKSA